MLERKTCLSIKNIDSFEPLLLGHPVLNHLSMISVQICVKEVKVGSAVTLDELIHNLGLEVVLTQSAPYHVAFIIS